MYLWYHQFPSLPPGSAAGSERYQMGWIQILQPRVWAGLDYLGSARLAPKIQKRRALAIFKTELMNFAAYGFCIHADQERKNMDSYWNLIERATMKNK